MISQLAPFRFYLLKAKMFRIDSMIEYYDVCMCARRSLRLRDVHLIRMTFHNIPDHAPAISVPPAPTCRSVTSASTTRP